MPLQPQRRTARAHAAAQGRQTQLLSGGCTCPLQISKKQAQLSSCWAPSSAAAPARPGTPSAQIYSTFCGVLPTETKPAPEAPSPVPRAAEEFFQSMDSRSISSGWGGEDRVRRWCKWPGRSYLQCLRPLRWSLGYHSIGHGTRRVVGTSPQLTGGGRTRARGCSCHLRARCRCHRRCGHQGRGRGYPCD